MIDWSRSLTRIETARSRTKPHHVPSISHPSDRQTLRMSRKLTMGMIMPIDLRASVVHIAQSMTLGDQIVAMPRIASNPTRPAAREADNDLRLKTRGGSDRPIEDVDIGSVAAE